MCLGKKVTFPILGEIFLAPQYLGLDLDIYRPRAFQGTSYFLLNLVFKALKLRKTEGAAFQWSPTVE